MVTYSGDVMFVLRNRHNNNREQYLKNPRLINREKITRTKLGKTKKVGNV